MAIGRVPGQTGIQPSIVTAKGDLIVATASGSVTNQSVGSNNQVLTADSAQADGVKWANGSAATLTTTGDILYASAANTPARLGIGSAGQVLSISSGVPTWSGFVGVQATMSAGQSVANNTQVALAFNTETNGFDTHSFHDNSTNNTRFTVPSGQAGYYLMTGITRVGFGAYGYSLWLLKNGGTLTTGCGVVPSGYDGPGIISFVANLAVGDYIEFAVQQGSGSAKTFLGNDSYTAATVFTMVKLGV